MSTFGYGPRFAAHGERHMRWIENPKAAGLRFVSYADDAAPRSVRHKGWYLDSEFQDETVRGVVFRMTSRHGEALFVPGYEDPFNGSADEGGPVALSFDEVFRAPADADYQDAVYEAGRRADAIAEHMAESEREYREATRAGMRWMELGEEIKTLRSAARDLIREMKAARRSGLTGWPTICSALRDRLAAIREESREAHKKREDLWRGYHSTDAFKENAA